MNEKSQRTLQSIGATDASEEGTVTGVAEVVVVRHERSWRRKTETTASIVLRDPYFTINLDTGNS